MMDRKMELRMDSLLPERRSSGVPDHRTESIKIVADGMVSVQDAVSFLGIKKSTLYKLMTDKELSYAKIGKRRLIPRIALIEFAARNLVLRKNVN